MKTSYLKRVAAAGPGGAAALGLAALGFFQAAGTASAADDAPVYAISIEGTPGTENGYKAENPVTLAMMKNALFHDQNGNERKMTLYARIKWDGPNDTKPFQVFHSPDPAQFKVTITDMWVKDQVAGYEYHYSGFRPTYSAKVWLPDPHSADVQVFSASPGKHIVAGGGFTSVMEDTAFTTTSDGVQTNPALIGAFVVTVKFDGNAVFGKQNVLWTSQGPVSSQLSVEWKWKAVPVAPATGK